MWFHTLYGYTSQYSNTAIHNTSPYSSTPIQSGLRAQFSWPLRTFPLTCSHFSTCLFLLQEPFFLAKFLDFPVERSKVNNLLFILLCGLTRRAEPMRDGPVPACPSALGPAPGVGTTWLYGATVGSGAIGTGSNAPCRACAPTVRFGCVVVSCWLSSAFSKFSCTYFSGHTLFSKEIASKTFSR